MNREFRELITLAKSIVREDWLQSQSIFIDDAPIKKRKEETKKPEEIAKPILKIAAAPTLEKEREDKELSRVEEMSGLFKKLYPQLYRSELPIFIILITRDERYFPFLKKISQFVTNTLAPSLPILCSNKEQFYSLLKRVSLKLIMASKSDVEFFLGSKTEERVHCLSKIDHINWLPIHNGEIYLKETNYKRDLWNTLQSLPLADLLQ